MVSGGVLDVKKKKEDCQLMNDMSQGEELILKDR